MGHGRGPSEAAVRKRSCRGRGVSPVHAIFSLACAAPEYARRIRSRSTERCRECRPVPVAARTQSQSRAALRRRRLVARRFARWSHRDRSRPRLVPRRDARLNESRLRGEQSSERRSRIGRRTFSAPSFHFPRGATPTSLLTLEDSDEIRSHGRTQETRRFAAGREEERI